jgi:pyridoxamine 5'-phosphate oxidase
MRILHREDYQHQGLFEKDLLADPMAQFARWYREAELSFVPEANAFHLATVCNQIPDVRVVLLKEYRPEGLVFFTNYESKKGTDLLENPAVCANFFWQPMMRQVRVTGSVTKLSTQESAEYFHSRPLGSQVGAVVSMQSQRLEDRKILEDAYENFEQSLGGQNPSLPSYWGGFLIQPTRFEFWQGRPSRLHDRLVYVKSDTSWKIERLYP